MRAAERLRLNLATLRTRPTQGYTGGKGFGFRLGSLLHLFLGSSGWVLGWGLGRRGVGQEGVYVGSKFGLGCGQVMLAGRRCPKF